MKIITESFKNIIEFIVELIGFIFILIYFSFLLIGLSITNSCTFFSTGEPDEYTLFEDDAITITLYDVEKAREKLNKQIAYGMKIFN